VQSHIGQRTHRHPLAHRTRRPQTRDAEDVDDKRTRIPPHRDDGALRRKPVVPHSAVGNDEVHVFHRRDRHRRLELRGDLKSSCGVDRDCAANHVDDGRIGRIRLAVPDIGAPGARFFSGVRAKVRCVENLIRFQDEPHTPRRGQRGRHRRGIRRHHRPVCRRDDEITTFVDSDPGERAFRVLGIKHDRRNPPTLQPLDDPS
jgi:hypothetical protein